MKKLVFLLLLLPSAVFSSPPFLFDAHFSPHASAPGLLYTQRHLTHWIITSKAYEAYQLNLAPFNKKKMGPDFNKRKQSFSTWTIFVRIFELYGVWGLLSDLYTEVQYEVFGYGYRLRTFGNFYYQDKHYKFYGLNPKRARIQALFENQDLLSRHNRLLLALSGYEACSILAHELNIQAMTHRLIEPRQSPLYLKSKFSLYFSILGTKKVRDLYLQSKHSNRQDWSHYFSQLCFYYSDKISSNNRLNQLRKKALLSIFLDPMTYSTLASQILYCLSGKTLSLPKTLILPSYELCLTPFGPEDIFACYFAFKKIHLLMPILK